MRTDYAWSGIRRAARRVWYRMSRVSVWVPDELQELIRDRLPGLNVSELVQAALRARLDCSHDELVCACCGTAADRRSLERAALEWFARDLGVRLSELAVRNGSAEGAVRILRSVSVERGVVSGASLPAARPSRKARESTPHEIRDSA